MEKKSGLERFNNQELISGIVSMIIFSAIKYLSMRLPAKVSTYPIAMSNVAFVLAIVFLIRCIVRFVRGTGSDKPMFKKDAAGAARYWLTLVLLVVYAIIFKKAGFVISSFLFMAAFTNLFDHEHKIVLNLIVSAVFVAVIYVAFKVILGIPLPSTII